MFPDQIKQQFDQDGFIIIPGFLPEKDFNTLTAELDRYIREVVPTLPDTAAFFHDRDRPETLKQLQHMSVDPFFDQYRVQNRWKALADLLIGEPSHAQQPEWFNKPPGIEHPTPPHQDNFYFCLEPSNVVTMWLSLDDVDADNGCLRYVAGSHLRGIRDHQATKVLGFSQGIVDYGPDDEQHEVAVTLQPGDLVVHHGETIHLADPNRTTDRNRRAFAMVFRGESCQRNEEAFKRYETAAAAQHRQAGLNVN